MDHWRTRLGRAGRALANALDRLSTTLTDFHGRLREAVVRTVGEAAAGAARDALAAVLAARPGDWRTPGPGVRSPYRTARDWDDPDDATWRPWPGAAAEESDDDHADHASRARPRRWADALAAGCRAASVWLRRPGRHPALAALGVGLVATLAVAVGGRWAATVAGLGGAALGLLDLADAAAQGAAMLSD